jgi:microcystin-dependent protein
MGTILPKGKTQFCDGNGVPLAGGRVYFYIPNTTTPQATYSDAALSIANTNPVVLDASGEAAIWGAGAYRQVVQDAAGNTIWDVEVTAPNVNFYAVDAGVANALSVTIPGISAPYIGMELNVLPGNTITGPSTISFVSGSGTQTYAITLGAAALAPGQIAAGYAAKLVFDGTNMQLLNSQGPASSFLPGMVMPFAGPTPPAGWDLCYGKTYSRTANAGLFAAIGTAWGAGDGSTTFLGPDFRGRGLFGADAMGGSAANRLTSASLGGSTIAVLGTTGGSESLQSHTHTATTAVTDPGHVHQDHQAHNITTGTSDSGPLSTTGAAATTQTGNILTAVTGITVTTTLAAAGTGASQNLPPAAIINWIMYVGN